MDVEIIVPLAFMASVFGIVYIVMRTKNLEKMAMIEKGVDASFFEKKNKNTSLREGLSLIGVAIGVLIGAALEHYTVLDKEAYFASVFLFAGIGLLLNDYIQRKRDVENK